MPVELQIPDIVWRRYAAYQDICKTEINSTIPGRTTEQNGPSGPADKANDTVPGSIFVAAGREEELKDLFDEIKIGGTD